MNTTRQVAFENATRLHEIVSIALEDLEAVEQDPHYVVDMGRWHQPVTPADHPICTVCFAGAVMSRSFNANITEEFRPWDFNYSSAQNFRALDFLREGGIKEAIIHFYTGKEGSEEKALNKLISQGVMENSFGESLLEEEYDFPEYEDDQEGFKTGIRKLIKVLKELDI